MWSNRKKKNDLHFINNLFFFMLRNIFSTVNKKPILLSSTYLFRYHKPILQKSFLLTKHMSTKSEQEWKVVLTPEQFRVLRQKGNLIISFLHLVH